MVQSPCFVLAHGARTVMSPTHSRGASICCFHRSASPLSVGMRRPLFPRRAAPVRPRAPVAMYNNDGGPRDVSTRVADAVLRAGRFLQTTNGQLLLWAGLVWLVLTGRIGFIFDSFLFIFIFFSVVPVLGLFAFRWWVGTQIVNGSCPNCGASVSGLRNQPFQCLNCGQQVSGDEKGFSWDGEPSNATIDIDAKSIDGD